MSEQQNAVTLENKHFQPSIRTIEIEPDRLLHSYLIDLITTFAQNTEKKEITIVDFGCKEGDIVDILCDKFNLTKDDSLPTPNIHISGYDPFLNSNAYAIQRALKKAQKNPALTAEFTSEFKEIPERADLLFAHFSLHHVPDLKAAMQEEIGGHISPSIIIVAEYDFQQIHQGSPQKNFAEFKKIFESTRAGIEERDLFVKEKDSEEAGWQKCYAIHTRLNEQDYIKEIEEAGYHIIKRIVPTSSWKMDRYKFMLVAVRDKKDAYDTKLCLN